MDAHVLLDMDDVVGVYATSEEAVTAADQYHAENRVRGSELEIQHWRGPELVYTRDLHERFYGQIAS